MDTNNMRIVKSRAGGRNTSRGISLIIVLIMMVIIGITAASAMRSATSEQRVTNNLRVEGTAQQYAEAALRYCEAQLQLASGVRVATLQTAQIPATTTALSGWEDPLSWAAGGGGRASSSLTTLTVAQVSDASNSPPATRPQCVAELQTMGPAGSTFPLVVVTARGFSPDYAANGDGTTAKGAVVWLQSFVNVTP